MTYTIYLAIFSALTFIPGILGQGPEQDEVTSLPGLSVKPNFRMYSGFLSAGPNRRLHYWFVGSQKGSAVLDPVIVWINGGPGCSSMLTLFMEHGPFRITDDGHNLVPNNFSWNKVANVLFLDAPIGTGYSYDATGNYNTDEEQAADETYLAILDFHHKFGLLSGDSFWIAGQGHAATHITLLVERLMHEPAVKLKGYAINNGVLDERSRGNSLMFFAYYHGVLGSRLWKNLTASCCNGAVTQNSCNFVDNSQPSCQNAVKEATNMIANQGLNVFNLYAKCDLPKNWTQDSLHNDRLETSPYHRSRMSLLRSLNISHLDIKWAPPCVDTSHVFDYMNREDVKNALHVEESPLVWNACSDVLKYKVLYTDLREIVRRIASSNNIRALFYYGDVDMASNFLGARWFLDSLRFKETVIYVQWLLHDQIGGYVDYYTGQMNYVTVKGAGHMISKDNPIASLQVISYFLQNRPF